MKNSEAELFNHVDQLLAGHERLLSDATRNRLFYDALKVSVTDGSSVLDIGSGTGLWAIAAALLGAKRVVAIEQDLLLTGLIKALAKANGVADRVEVIQGDSRQIQLDREFDVVISETIGHLVFDEQIASIMIDARKRFLKPGGILIPQSVALIVAAAHLKETPHRLPADIAIDYGYFESLLLNRPINFSERANLKILSAPQELVRADLTDVESSPALDNLEARWKPQLTDQINCFALWAEATLAPGVRLETLQTSSWFPTVYRISPFKTKQGEIEFKLKLTSESHYWTATLTDGQSQEVQSYSPASAATTLLARAQTDFDLVGHLQRIGLVT